MSHPIVLDFERPLLSLERRIHELEARTAADAEDVAELERLRRKADAERRRLQQSLTPWQRVQIARHPGRPRPAELLESLVQDFVELHGDRVEADDAALLCGLGYLQRRRVAVLCHGRGRAGDGDRPLSRLPSAAGLRKAARVVELAARFELPLLTLVDTAFDALPDPAQDAAAGPPLTELATLLLDLPGPSLAVVVGEAYGEIGLGLTVADRVLCLENAICAPVTPERAARVEHGDPSRADELAAPLRLTAEDAQTLGLADAQVPEPPGGAHRDPERLRDELASAVQRELTGLRARPPAERAAGRRARLDALTALVAETR